MVGREADGPPYAILGRFWDYVGALGALLGPMLAVLGRSWALMGGLGPLLGPLCPVLGCSWSVCWRSWAPEKAKNLIFEPELLDKNYEKRNVYIPY